MQQPNRSQPPLKATPAMCYHCFDVLIDSLQKTKNGYNNGTHNLSNTAAIPEFASQLVDTSVKCPLFVTWTKRIRDDNWQLRGCIGTLSPRLLTSAVGEYALISALRDQRFSPIAMSELTMLRVQVSLLVCYEDCTNVYDWTLGIHGVLIHFHVQGKDFSATYLPDVVIEQGWDHRKTISSLIEKAGYHGPVSERLLGSIKCTRYQSTKCRVSFGEYVLEKCQGNDPLIVPPQPRQYNPCNNL